MGSVYQDASTADLLAWRAEMAHVLRVLHDDDPGKPALRVEWTRLEAELAKRKREESPDLFGD